MWLLHSWQTFLTLLKLNVECVTMGLFLLREVDVSVQATDVCQTLLQESNVRPLRSAATLQPG